jgi:hypothetical protein
MSDEQAKSLKIEERNGTEWKDGGDWRFPLEDYEESDPAKLCQARLYMSGELRNRQGIVNHLRVSLSTDAPNCHLVGGIGQSHLEYTDR